jgi:methyl-accepting chemotaxis protein
MATTVEKPSYFKSPWATIGRIAFSAIFFFWFYLIWNSTTGLNEKLEAPEARLTAVHEIQIEFKKEVQEWKDLLLRSEDQATFDQHWRAFAAQHQKVAAAAQDIMSRSDERKINEPMKNFLAAHAENYEKYKNSAILFVKGKYDHDKADAAVAGIDRPLFDTLEAAETGVLEENKRTTDNLLGKARNQIEISLFALAFIGLLAVWMPKH